MVSSCRFPAISSLVRGLIVVSLAVSSICSVTRAAAQTPLVKPLPKSNLVAQHQPITPGTSNLSAPTGSAPRPIPPLGGCGARLRLSARRPQLILLFAGLWAMPSSTPKVHSNAIVGIPGSATQPATLDQLYFSGVYPNYANSPLPQPNDPACAAPNFCGMRKFVDTLPGLNAANDLGNMIPVAVPGYNHLPGIGLLRDLPRSIPSAVAQGPASCRRWRKKRRNFASRLRADQRLRWELPKYPIISAQ